MKELSPLILRQLVVQSLNIIFSIYSARLLSVESYAYLNLNLYVYASLSLLADLGLWSVYQRSSSEESKKFQFVIFKISLIFTSLLAIPFLLLTAFGQLNILKNIAEIIGLLLTVICTVLNQFQNFMMAVYEKKLAVKSIAHVEILQSLIFYSVILFIINAKLDIWTIFIAFFLRLLIPIIWYIRNFIIKNYRHSNKPISPKEFVKCHRELIGSGLKFQSSRWIYAVKDLYVVWFCAKNLTLTMYGNYTWLIAVGSYPSLVLLIQQRIYLPLFSKLVLFNDNKLASLASALIIKNLWIIYPASIYSLYYSSELVQLVFGEKWGHLSSMIWMYSSSLFSTPFVIVCMSYLDARGKSQINLYMSLIWSTLTIFGISIILLSKGLQGYGLFISSTQILNLAYFIVCKKLFSFSSLKKISLNLFFIAAFSSLIIMIVENLMIYSPIKYTYIIITGLIINIIYSFYIYKTITTE